MITIKKYFAELKKIDKRFLLVLLFSTLVPIIYSYLRLMWITSEGSETYSMTSFNAYINALAEVFTAFLILPVFSYRKQEYRTKSNSLLFSVFLASMVLLIILLIINYSLLEKMIELNPDASREELLTFLRLTSISKALEIFETYLIYEIAIEKNSAKGIFITTLSLMLKIVIDILLISKFAIVDFNIINVALSSLISTLIVIGTLVILYFFNQHKTITIQKIHFNDMLNFYKRGFFPGLDKLIGNFFYTFVTLAIVNHLGEVQ